MFDKGAIKNNFSRAAKQYDSHARLQETIRRKAADMAVDYFEDGETILDIGCGTGAFALEQPQWDIIGVDLSFGMCKIAKEKNAIVVNGDAALLPFADESFHSVFSSLFLQWAENPEVIIKEILRIMKAGGSAVLTTFTMGTLKELEEAFLAVDNAPHISDFVNQQQLLFKIAHIGGLVMEADEHTYIQHYDDMVSLMRSIKNIGASNKHHNRRKGLMTTGQLKKVENAYKRENGKFPLSWDVLTIAIGKY